jgi:hypothetical protein
MLECLEGNEAESIAVHFNGTCTANITLLRGRKYRTGRSGVHLATYEASGETYGNCIEIESLQIRWLTRSESLSLSAYLQPTDLRSS